jgi:hypothetical protein
MMRHIVSAACGLWLCLGSGAVAQSEPGVVVELYTSQGCSSCPPADEILAKLSRQPGIIALALHVDYWDYIGWEDTFADRKFTSRQKAYAHAAGSKMIYTPQMIVGGREQVEGNQPTTVARAIDAHMGMVGQVTLTAERQGNKVTIRAVANPPLTRPARVQVVRYLDRAEVAIERGENAGLNVAYHNIVTVWDDVGAWHGDAPLQMTAQAAGGAPVVVIVQSEGPGEILAAVRLR